MHASGLYKVSGSGKHGNARMLELGGTEPGKGAIGTKGGKTKRIKALKWRGGPGHIREARAQRGSSVRILSGSEGIGNAGKGNYGSGNLHGVNRCRYWLCDDGRKDAMVIISQKTKETSRGWAGPYVPTYRGSKIGLQLDDVLLLGFQALIARRCIAVFSELSRPAPGGPAAESTQKIDRPP